MSLDAEARERWSHTAAWRESRRRTASYGSAEMRSIRAEADWIEAGFAEALAAGADPTGASATGWAERHRQHLDRWFYRCSHRMHAALGAMYFSDPRFRKHYDDRAPGLAEFVRDAIRANDR